MKSALLSDSGLFFVGALEGKVERSGSFHNVIARTGLRSLWWCSAEGPILANGAGAACSIPQSSLLHSFFATTRSMPPCSLYRLDYYFLAVRIRAAVVSNFQISRSMSTRRPRTPGAIQVFCKCYKAESQLKDRKLRGRWAEAGVSYKIAGTSSSDPRDPIGLNDVLHTTVYS